ncbi:hypothetical protein CRYUN_Cryun09bG0106600 [Craigia yunnanensis]
MENKKMANKLNPPVSMKKIRKGDPIPEGDYVLRLTINNAEGIDPPSKYPGVTLRNYRVLTWIDPGDQYLTDEVTESQKLEWNRLFDIPLNNVVTLESKFLSLEVIRVHSRCDPGPSKGVVVVGRVKVPLPKALGIKHCRRVGLVRFVEGATMGEGHITITMKLLQVNEHW